MGELLRGELTTGHVVLAASLVGLLVVAVALLLMRARRVGQATASKSSPDIAVKAATVAPPASVPVERPVPWLFNYGPTPSSPPSLALGQLAPAVNAAPVRVPRVAKPATSLPVVPSQLGTRVPPPHVVPAPVATAHEGKPELKVVPRAADSAIPVIRPKPRLVREVRETEDTVLSPETLLARAHGLLATGATEEAAGQLRLCVRLAAKLKQPLIEASARLELGDLARASGDLTTACEHWQMARTLFTTLKRDADRVQAEQRMERARCPSDWVLNEF